MMRFGDLDNLLRQRVDDQDSTNPLFPEANRFRALNKAIRKVASIIDEADEGYRQESKNYTSVADQGEYQLPENCERLKQVINLDSDGLERTPPRSYVPWIHRFKYQQRNTLNVTSSVRIGGGYYSYRNSLLVLIPTPTSSSTYVDVRLWFLPAIQEGADAESEIDLPEFAKNLVVAFAAAEILDPTGEPTDKHEREITWETAIVQRRVTPRTDDGPMRVSDDRGDTSLAAGFSGG